MNRILIVDDDKDLADAIGLILESVNYQVIVSYRGDNLLDIVKKERPNLVVMDVLLGGFDGRLLCRELKKEEDIPVLMMSAHPKAHLSIDHFQANGFLSKPFEIDDLRAKVEELIAAD